MSSNLETVKKMYDAFGRGDVATIVANMADEIVWSFEANSAISWGGIRRGPKEAVGFFEGIHNDLTDNKHYFRFLDGKVVEYRNLINTAAFSDAMNSSSASA